MDYSKMITALTKGLAGNLAQNKSVKDFLSDFTNATVEWLRPIFLKDDDTEKEIITDLKKEPNENIYIQATEIEIAKSLKRNPDNYIHLKNAILELQKEGKLSKEATQLINGDENISLQNIHGSNINVNQNEPKSK